MKRTLCLLLSFNFLLIPVAGASMADSQALARKFTLAGMPKAFQTLRSLNLSNTDVDETLKKISASRPAEFAAHAGQTLLFILTMAGIDLVFQEMSKTGEANPSQDSLTAMATKAATQIVNSGGTWSSMVGAGAAATALDYPAVLLSQLIADPKTHELLFEGLRGSILTTGGFLGWDAGAQLWTEATYQLKDAADFDRAKSLFGMGGGALRALLLSPAPSDRSDLRVAGLMFVNIFKVALFDQSLREQWIGNYWRTRIMTGEFATLLASVLGASAAGSIILPGGGTVAGFMFGVVGVSVSLVIPQEIKNSITSGLQTVRSHFTFGKLGTNEILLRERISANDSQGIQRLLSDRRQLRSNYLTVGFERMRAALKTLLKSPQQREAALKSVHDAFDSGIAFLQRERMTLQKLNLQSEIARIDFLENFMRDMQTLDPTGDDQLKFIEIAYSRGFSEDTLLSLAN